MKNMMKPFQILPIAAVFCLSLLASSCDLLVQLVGELPRNYQYNQHIDLTLSIKDSGVMLNWTPVNDADVYWIERLHFPGISFDENSSLLESTTATLFHDVSEIVPGQTYRYVVRGLVTTDSGSILLGESDIVSISIPVPISTLPVQPKGLNVEAIDGSVDLSWTSCGEGLVYDVYYSFGVAHLSIPYPGEYVLYNRAPLDGTRCTVDTATLQLGNYSDYSGYLYFHVTATDQTQNTSYPSLPVRITYPLQ